MSRLDALLASPRLPALALIAASIGTLLAALFFQYVIGLQPCILCIYQRWPYVMVAVLAALALALPGRPPLRALLLALAGLALVVGAGIAAFHVGVEQHWWTGTPECGGTPAGNVSVDDLYAQIMKAPVVRCDEVAWSLFGVSMAGYNIAISLGLAAVAFAAARRALTSWRPA